MLIFNNTFDTKNLKSFEVIGPHDKIIYAIIIGSLLGQSYAEKRKTITRIHFCQNSMNMEYLYYIYTKMQERGYCSDKKATFIKKIGKKNRVYFSYTFRTFSFASFNWIYALFYNEKGIKVIPQDIEKFLYPQSLAIWIMDSANRRSTGIFISINSLSELDIERLQKALLKKFDIVTSKENQGLFFYNNQIEKLSKIIKPYMLSSMYYKIQSYKFK